MTCTTCGGDAPDKIHQFHEGGDRPVRAWTIVAPQYFRANEANTAALEGFCSPACATARFLELVGR